MPRLRISRRVSVIESNAYAACVLPSFCVSSCGRLFTIGDGVVDVSGRGVHPRVVWVRREQVRAVIARDRGGVAARRDRRPARQDLDAAAVEEPARHERAAPRLFPGELGPQRDGMLDRAGVEDARQVGL